MGKKYFNVSRLLAFGLLTFALNLLMSPPSLHADDSRDAKDLVAMKVWLSQVALKAQGEGITKTTIKKVFDDIHFVSTVGRSYKNQPEVVLTFKTYTSHFLSPSRIEKGRDILKAQRANLEKIANHFKVDPWILLAIWGMESNYGSYTGNHLVVDSLATLGALGKKRKYPEQQMLAILKIVQRDKIDPKELLGSWAGAMGQTQFIPTTYLDYAVDFNKDGKKDIWHSQLDALASTAFYLKKKGHYVFHKKWGIEIQAQSAQKALQEFGDAVKTLRFWKKHKIMPTSSTNFPSDLPSKDLKIIKVEDRFFLVGRNFHAFLAYNHSNFYALSVGILSDTFRDLWTQPL